MTMHFTGLPHDLPALSELQTRNQWVAWKLEYRNGPDRKPTKPPVSPKSGFGASHSDPRTWGTYHDALQLAVRRKLPGVGYVISPDDEYTGIDLDDVVDDDGEVTPWAKEIIGLAETYCEISPSGRGLRLIARGKIDRSVKCDPANVEIYRDSRYLTITGSHWPGTPTDIRPAPKTIKALLARVATLRPGLGETRSSDGLASVQPSGIDVAEIEELLSYIPADCGYHDWVSVLMAIHAATGGEGLAIADAWSARGGDKYPGSKEIEKKWRSFKRSGISGRTLAQIAREHGADLSAIAIKHKVPEVDPIEAAAAARRLIENHDGSLADAETGEIVNTEISVVQPSASSEIYPPGLVGDIARWIVETARKPQPELAIGAALAIVGTVAGRQFAGPTRSGTHLYVLGLAPTGTGKDHPLQQISRIMTAAKLSLHLGPSEFISMPAVVNFIMRKPLSICPMDEFGGFMKRINSRRASGFEGAISKVIRTLWSSSFAPYATPEWAQKESQTVYSPAITLFGASTPEQFYSSMEGASLEDGTLNRFLLLNGRDRASEQEPMHDPAMVPVDIVNDMHLIYYRSGQMSSTFRNDPNSDPAMAGQLRELKWCPDGAHARYKAFSAEVDRIMRQEADRAAFYARTSEMALRIATIVAVGRLDDDQVRLSDLEYGIGLAMRSSQMMTEGAADYMAENENQANAQKVLRIIKARGGRIKHRDLLYALRHGIKARELRDLITMMCESGQLERCSIASASGPDAAGYMLSPPD